jgi:hypothetical protein
MKIPIKQIFKRLFLITAGFIALILITLISILGTFFYDPTIFINPTNLDYTLKKTNVLENWSWRNAEINHQWIHWNQRRLYGGFQDLCLVFDNADVNVDTCIEKVSWNVELKWTLSGGLSYIVYEPLLIDSSKLKILLKENNEETPPPDLMSYWDILWSPLIPDLNINFQKIDILKKDMPLSFSLKAMKKPETLSAEAFGFSLLATPKKISIFAPKKILLPFDLKTRNPLYFSEIKLEANILATTIPVVVSAKLESGTFKIQTTIVKSSLKEDLSKPKFLSEMILATTGSLEVTKVKSTIDQLARPPYNILPAPFNVMEGSLKISVVTEKYVAKDSVLLKIKTQLNMKGEKQDLKLTVNSEVPFMLQDKSIGSIVLGLELQKVKLLLPALAKTKLPPQILPDSRFKNTTVVVRENLNQQNLPPQVKKSPVKKEVELDMKLQALGGNALHIKTNLLDEALRLNFDLEISNGEIQKGWIQALPLKTTIFKRKIVIPSLRVVFNAPLEPEIVATIEFHLPEYTITLQLEGPTSKPRQAFSSQPPLPLDDIYAVLLFGRPLSGLDPGDKTAAQKSNQLISQGVLSLAVLYYFAGSPIESIGYDPESNEVSAQIGLGAKNSLRVGGSGSGLNSAGVRRSLGKGWYIDSSIERTTNQNGMSGGGYGVLLERIISY